ncbi:MAG TPA: NAD(P)/FAD-dependent oxidoreductase [Gemmatimonadaceae bacterium]
MAEPFDLIVIGTGSAGSAPAYRCRKAGWRVAIVDELPYGGTCALRGCDPKKVLVGAAELVDWQRRMHGHGATGEAHIAWGDLMRFKRTFTDPVPDNRQAGFDAVGIVTLHGSARFVAPDALAVGDEVLHARHFVIASGAEPRHLEFPGAEHLRTSTDFLELDELPRRIVFVGGGYISFEFAHVAARAGAAVTIVARGRPLRQFEPDLVDRLVAHTRSLGVTVHTEADVARAEPWGGGFRVHMVTTGHTDVVDADLVVHGAGRVPATARLALDKADVATSRGGGVAVNEYLRSTTNPRVYAAGDVTSTPGSLPLTPVAGYEGTVVASNLLESNHRRAEYGAIPSAVFTVPTLATVGLTQAQAAAQGVNVRIETHDTTDWYSNRRVAAECGMAKVLIEQGTDRMVGAHLLGHHTEELVNLFALAMNHGILATALRHHIYAYPTGASDIPHLV